MRRRRFAGLWLPLCVALLFAGAAVGHAQPAPSPVIPDFFDPNARTERPPAGAIPSIRFITSDDFPPFNFVDPSGRLIGFNVDLARALCDELGAACTIQARPFDDLVPALVAGRADAAVAGIAITAESRRLLDFSAVYLRAPGRFVTRRGTPLAGISGAALAGHPVAVVAGSAHEAFLATLMPEVPRLPFPTAEEAHAALLDGRADAHFGDGIQLSFWLQSEAAADCCAFAGGPYLENRYFGLGFAIGLRRGQEALREAIDSALEALQADGTYAELYLRYFPISFF